MINIEDINKLIDQGLVQKKDFDNGLSVYKYKNKVFYDNLWHLSDQLNYCRGLVLDSDGKVVVWPFTKIYNRFENKTDLPLDKKVVSVGKMNGFMASATIYKDELLVSTTGSLDSPHAKMAEKYIKKLKTEFLTKGFTFIFEICSPEDPHIVDEVEGVYLIGARWNFDGSMLEEKALDIAARFLKCERPSWKYCNFSEVVEDSKYCTHEGFVVRDVDSGELLLKIKSPFYLSRKFFMRGGDRKWDKLWDNPKKFKKTIDEEYYPVVDFLLTKDKDWWKTLDQQERKKWVEEVLC